MKTEEQIAQDTHEIIESLKRQGIPEDKITPEMIDDSYIERLPDGRIFIIHGISFFDD